MKKSREQISIPFLNLIITLSYDTYVILSFLIPVLLLFGMIALTSIKTTFIITVVYGIFRFLKDIKIERDEDE